MATRGDAGDHAGHRAGPDTGRAAQGAGLGTGNAGQDAGHGTGNAGQDAGRELPAEISAGQAADLLGVSRRTVVHLIERGDLAATRVGTRRRVAAAEVLAVRERARSQRRATLRDVIAASRDLDLYR